MVSARGDRDRPNTGEVVCGNIEFSADGLHRHWRWVNLAARLEAPQDLRRQDFDQREHGGGAPEGVCAREVGLLRVKGKTEPVAVYEALDWTAAYPEQAFPNRDAVLHHFHIGTEYYKGRSFDRAQQSFQKALQLHPGDKVAQLYVDRCAAFIASPPAPDWDGVWTMTTK